MAHRDWKYESEQARKINISRRKVLQGMLATGAAIAAGEGISPWRAQAAARNQQVILAPGSRPNPQIPEGVDTMPQIEHIVIYMQENHSFDSYYGVLGRGDGYTMGPDGIPLNWNPDLNGKPFRVFHQTDTCNVVTGDHGWDGEHLAWNFGAMNNFIRDNQSPHVMGYFDGSNLPFYYGLANQFPICDRWFSSVMGPTHPNRRYLQAATSVGLVDTSVELVLEYPNAPNGTIWDRLNAYGISWTDYAIDIWDVLLFPTSNPLQFIESQAQHLKHYPNDFLSDCLNGTLPSVSIIAPGTQDQYDEGARDVQNGEAYSYSIINAVMASPVWDKTVIFFTYDESGGCFDHVPPPPAVIPDNIPPLIEVPPRQPGAFDRYGMRVPGFVISPFSKQNYVSHTVRDHTSILKFIETKFNLGAMTYRDANADDLTDCLDFNNPAFSVPPVLPAPGLPATGSACEPQPRPPVNPLPKTATGLSR
ncbi:MAG TPA: alkaline phosphatase family protein [Acidimicrobiales bacterium]|nr:alkaline phosphatase family protein [Acidimicrobiales bacterium]